MLVLSNKTMGARARGGLPPNGYLLVLLDLRRTEFLLLPAGQNQRQAMPVAAGPGLLANDHSAALRSSSIQIRHSLKTLRILTSLFKAGWAGGPGFDFADVINTVGAPSFAFFAKGGFHERLQLRSYDTRSRNEIFVHPSFTCTGPASSRR